VIGPFPSTALVRREFLSTLRKPRMLVYTSLAVLACIGGVVLMWPSAQAVQIVGAKTSTVLLNVVTVVLMAGCGLFLPALAATAITSERDDETYDMLHLSLIMPAGMAFGKMLNALGVYWLLALSLMPVLGVTFFLVGLSWQHVLVRAAVIAWMAVAIGAVGIYCSARFQRTVVAIAASYFGALFVFGIPWVFGAAVLEFFRIRVFWLVEAACDVFMLRLEQLAVAVVPPTIIILDSRMPAAVNPLGPLIYLTLLALFFFRLTLRALRRPPKVRVPKLDKPIDDAARLHARRKRFPYYLIDPLKRKKIIEDGRNPVLVRELRWGVLGRMTVMVRVFYGALAVDWAVAVAFMLAFGGVGTNRIVDATAVAMTALTICTLLPAPILLSSLFVKEREHNKIEMLQMTLLRPTQILMGKLGAAAVQLSPLVVAAVLTSVIVVAPFGLARAEWENLLMLGAGLVTLFVCVWTVAALSLAVSLLARTTAGALVETYALALILFAGTSAALHLALQSAVIRRSIPPDLRHILSLTASSFSPLFSYVGLLERSRQNSWTFWIASCVMFILLGAVLMLGCTHRVNRGPERAKRRANVTA